MTWIRRMVTRLLLWLINLLTWCARRTTVEPPRSLDPMYLLVARLVRRYEAVDGSGEFKRRQVYARVLKAFPERPHAQVGFAIEQVLQSVRQVDRVSGA